MTIHLLASLWLSANYYGPLKILAIIGLVAYKLELPPESSIRLVFHVCLLKKKVENSISTSTSLPQLQDDDFIMAPEKVLQTGTILRGADMLNRD